MYCLSRKDFTKLAQLINVAKISQKLSSNRIFTEKSNDRIFGYLHGRGTIIAIIPILYFVSIPIRIE